jgi:phosphate transport system substrate-binding protein
MASVALAFFATRASADAQERISVRGPADVLERLSDFREAVARWHPDLDVEWSGDEGVASFGELFDGSVDLLLSTRALSPREQSLARRLSLEIHETVAGLDAVAVVVHPDNFVESLTLEQLRTLFSGKIVGWYGFGGSDRAVRLLAPVPWSGEYQALALLPGAQFRLSPAADLVPSPSAVIARPHPTRGVGLYP